MKKIYLIDANSFIYRMFYGVPEFITKKGEYVNAVFGIARFFLEQLVRENPDYIIFIKDAKGKNFRHNLDKNYKATRDKMPDNLRSQMPIISDMIKKMWVPIIEISWVEADDVIWTLAKKYNWSTECEVDILTWDKDLYSLVSNNIYIYDTMKKKKYWPDETLEKFWVEPKMIIDYLAIVWDKADNIPWIDGFWPKKAVTLLNNIWGIEEIYKIFESWEFENLDLESKKVFKWKNLEKLENSKDNAFLSKKLATIKLNVELENFDLEEYKFKPENYLNENIKTLFRELEFNSLLNEQPPKLKKWDDLGLKVNIIWNDIWLDELFELIKCRGAPCGYPDNKINDNKIIGYPQGAPLREYDKNTIVLDTETSSLNIMEADLVWISIYLDDKNIFYINRMHNWSSPSDTKLKEFLNKLFDLDILLIGHNIKYDLEIIELFMTRKIDKKLEEKVWQMSFEI